MSDFLNNHFSVAMRMRRHPPIAGRKDFGMTSALPASSIESGEQDENDLLEIVEEISAAVAAGLVPFLCQAINIYDTIESLLSLNNSHSAEAQAEAKFDLVLALVGWIPGAGAGVKRTIRIVN